MSEKKLGLGIAAGFSTGIFWGLPFLFPQMLRDFSAFEIAFGRFFFFGVVSLLFFKKAFAIFKKLPVVDRWMIFLLSATGFWLYSTVLFWSVQKTDGIISSLVIGLLPITIPLLTPNRKNSGIQFYLGLAALFLGLVNLIFYPVLQGMTEIKTPSYFGVAGLFSCLAMWTFFGITNSRFLQKRPSVNRRDFASVIGIVSLLSMIPFFLIKVDAVELIHRPHFATYVLCSMALGFGSSWLANWLWNICSFHCPSEIAGPLIVSETLFGLLYSFFYESRLPHFHESISIGLFAIGVFLAVSSQMKKTRI